MFVHTRNSTPAGTPRLTLARFLGAAPSCPNGLNRRAELSVFGRGSPDALFHFYPAQLVRGGVAQLTPWKRIANYL